MKVNYSKTTVIEAGHTQKYYWSEIWKFKELMWILAMRDVTVRYKQTFIGVAWSIVRPLSNMAVGFFVFNKIAQLPPEPGVPYLITIYSGTLIWNFFSNSLQSVNNSIVHNANLISKVFFPRLIVSISSIFVSFVDFLIGFSFMIPLITYYFFRTGFTLSWHILFLPFFLLLGYFAAFGFGLILAVLNVKYRDFSQITPFLIQFGFFACPVNYTTLKIEGFWWYKLYCLNPLVGLIHGFRWSLSPAIVEFHWESFIPSIILISIATVFSIYFFRKRENTFVDYI
jgi:lipopolysaccharide transport system permease protein